MNDYIEDFVEDLTKSLCLPGVPHAQLKTETVWLSLMARELPNQHFSQTARN